MSRYLVNYSAIVDGEGTTFGRPEDHEREVERVLAQLIGSRTGYGVFRKIVTHGVVRIQPHIPTGTDFFHVCNAFAIPQKYREQITSGLSRPAILVKFSPGTWAPGNGCLFGPGAQPDEMLLHELVHAMRLLGGEFKQVPLQGKLAGYEDEEEYFGVLIANIYISEMGRQPNFWVAGPGQSGLRKDHGLSQLSDDQALAVDFLMDADNFRLVKKFCDQHPNIAPVIGEADGRFNPIKVYYRWKKLNIEPRGGVFTRMK